MGTHNSSNQKERDEHLIKMSRTVELWAVKMDNSFAAYRVIQDFILFDKKSKFVGDGVAFIQDFDLIHAPKGSYLLREITGKVMVFMNETNLHNYLTTGKE